MAAKEGREGACMIEFTDDEMTLMMIYNPGSREGLIIELTNMQKAPTSRDRNLRKWTKSVLEKLYQMTDADFEKLELFPDFG